MNILIAGTFDHFHIGHQWLCWSAYDISKDVTVIVARDKTVKNIKQRETVNAETNRLKRVQAEFIAYPTVKVRLGRVDADFQKTIQEENPDLIYLGYDQKFNPEIIKKQGIQVKRCTAYKPEFFKSSKF